MICYNHSKIGYSGEFYGLSYQELKENYLKICNYTTEEFLNNIPEAAHLACIICWLKEISSEICLCDKGIIHQLVHMLHKCKLSKAELRKLRQQFKTELKLI